MRINNMLIYDILPIDYLPEGTWLNCDPKDKDAWSRQTRKVFEAQRIINLRPDNSWIWINEESNITDKRWKELTKPGQIIQNSTLKFKL